MKKIDGFSLVELSIVLVILGLLVGGVLTGQSLIRAAELRSGIAQIQQYSTAILSFRDKYFALPGDMPNATAFWGVAAGNGSDADCFGTESTTRATCNGTGDGRIHTPPGVTSGVHFHHEGFRAWQHLANAGLIEGSFTGRTDSTSVALQRTPGKNVPVSKLGGASGARLNYADHEKTSYYDPARSYVFNMLFISGALTPEENWNIDTKMDDGNPVWGTVFAPNSAVAWSLNCTTSTDAATAQYNLTSSDKNCVGIMYKLP